MNMQQIVAHTLRFAREEGGPTAAEYAILLALIVVASIAAINLFGISLSNLFRTLAGILNDIEADTAASAARPATAR